MFHSRVWAAIAIPILMAACSAGSGDPPTGTTSQELAAQYVPTPNGFFHPSCIVQLADDEVMRGDAVIERSDGTRRAAAPCALPHYNMRGHSSVDPQAEAVAQATGEPAAALKGWVESVYAYTPPVGYLSVQFQVPRTPLTTKSEVDFWFPGTEPLKAPSSEFAILQPVLAWGQSGIAKWTIQSWACCLKNTTLNSAPVDVEPGDTITGTMQASNCDAAGQCANWRITTKDERTGASTTLNTADGSAVAEDWLFGGVLEIYGVNTCAQLPPNGVFTFSNIVVKDTKGNPIVPSWTPEYLQDSPSCGLNLASTANSVTLMASPQSQLNSNGSLAVANWPSDGHTEVFGKTTAGAAFHVFTEGPSDTWGAIEEYSGAASCGVASAMWPQYPNSKGGVQLFDPSPTGATQTLHWSNGVWGSFAPFNGGSGTQLSTVVWPDGHPEVFILGSNSAISHNFWNSAKSAWSGWRSMGGTSATGATPLLWMDGTVNLFATNENGTVSYRRSTPGGWGAWTTVGSLGSGAGASRPVPVRRTGGAAYVFGRSPAGFLRMSSASQGGGWSAFEVLEGTHPFAGEPSAIAHPNGWVEVFARDTTGQVVHLQQTGQTTWTEWTALGGQATASDPLAWVRTDGRAEIFAVDAQGNLVRTIEGSGASTWSAWSAIASGIDACNH